MFATSTEAVDGFIQVTPLLKKRLNYQHITRLRTCLFTKKSNKKKDFMSGQASENNMFTKEGAAVPGRNKKRDININVRRKRLSMSLQKKRKAVSPKKTHTCSDENLIYMSTTVGRAPVSFSSKIPVTAELRKKEPPHSSSPTLTPSSNVNTSMSPLTPAGVHSAAEKTPLSRSETITTSPSTKIDVSTIPLRPLKMSGGDDNSTDVSITKITKPSSSSPGEEQAGFPIKVIIPPDYYVPIDSRSTKVSKPGLFKSRADGNSVCPNTYLSLTEKERKRALETAIAGVQISESERVKGWDPTDIIRLLPASHKLSDSLLSNLLVNKIFLMIEEEAIKQGKRVHTCNMEVLQPMTVPSIEVFLKCQYDQLYSDILESEVILCPSLHADHWCLVVVYPAIKRMVYLDSLFRGIGARKAFQCVGNFIACAMQLKGQEYGVDEWDFFTIPTNDIEQQ